MRDKWRCRPRGSYRRFPHLAFIALAVTHYYKYLYVIPVEPGGQSHANSYAEALPKCSGGHVNTRGFCPVNVFGQSGAVLIEFLEPRLTFARHFGLVVFNFFQP